jgi:hypothetical protein
MSSRHIRAFCELSADCERLLERAMTQQGLSARAHDRILKVARTVADLEDSANLEPKHIAEATRTAAWTARTGRKKASRRMDAYDSGGASIRALWLNNFLKTRFWVAQRFERCDRAFVSVLGFRPRGARGVFQQKC